MENSNSTIVKIPSAIIFASFIMIIAGVMYGSSLITQVLMALFISIICSQPILWLQKKKVPQGLSILIVFGLITIVFIGFGEVIGRSLSSFSENAPLYEKNLNEMGSSFVQFFNDRGMNVSFHSMTEMVVPSKIMGPTAGILSQLGGVMGNALMVLFLALFLLLELDGISIKAKVILNKSTHSVSYFSVLANNIRHYLSIKTITSLFTGVLVGVGLAITGVDYAIIWGLLPFF